MNLQRNDEGDHVSLSSRGPMGAGSLAPVSAASRARLFQVLSATAMPRPRLPAALRSSSSPGRRSLQRQVQKDGLMSAINASIRASNSARGIIADTSMVSSMSAALGLSAS